jgi:hypothetical protein
MLIRTIVLLVLTASAFGQSAPGAPSAEHHPVLTHAEVPLYPPVAWAAHFGGTVEIQVTVENGVVVDAQVKSGMIEAEIASNRDATSASQSKLLPYLSAPSLANVKTWQFGAEQRTSFLVTYAYRIEGTETPLPENPKVELDLPRLVRVTVKPFKPSCSDCVTRNP